MSASDVARHHFDAAIDQADADGLDRDGLCRALLCLVVVGIHEARRAGRPG